jgi:uncharacterized membrane protein YcaP (DUF421 family)
METVVRVAIVYVFLMVGLRVLGKREFGQMSPLELVTLLLIPELVSQSLIREDFSLINGLVAVTTLLTLTYVTSLVVHRSRRAEAVISGRPAVLVAHGRFRPQAMNLERVTPDELFNEMHNAGLERLDQVRWAVLESDGQIAIVPEEQSPPVIPNKEKARRVQ